MLSIHYVYIEIPQSLIASTESLPTYLELPNKLNSSVGRYNSVDVAVCLTVYLVCLSSLFKFV